MGLPGGRGGAPGLGAPARRAGVRRPVLDAAPYFGDGSEVLPAGRYDPVYNPVANKSTRAAYLADVLGLQKSCGAQPAAGDPILHMPVMLVIGDGSQDPHVDVPAVVSMLTARHGAALTLEQSPEIQRESFLSAEKTVLAVVESIIAFAQRV